MLSADWEHSQRVACVKQHQGTGKQKHLKHLGVHKFGGDGAAADRESACVV